MLDRLRKVGGCSTSMKKENPRPRGEDYIKPEGGPNTGAMWTSFCRLRSPRPGTSQHRSVVKPSGTDRRCWAALLGGLLQQLAGEDEIPGLETLGKLRVTRLEQGKRRLGRSVAVHQAHRSPEFPSKSAVLARSRERLTQQRLRLDPSALHVLSQETAFHPKKLRKTPGPSRLFILLPYAI